MTVHSSIPALLRDGQTPDSCTTLTDNTVAKTTFLTERLDPNLTEGCEDCDYAAVLTTLTTKLERRRGSAAYVTTVRIVVTGLAIGPTGRPTLHPQPGVQHRYVAIGADRDGTLMTYPATTPSEKKLSDAHTAALRAFHDANDAPHEDTSW